MTGVTACRFGCEEDFTDWLAPCKCAGSIKYVHKVCLERWQRTQYEKCSPLSSDALQARVFTCHICQHPYSHRVALPGSTSSFLRAHPSLSVFALLFLLILSLPLLLNLALASLTFVACCYFVGLRPDIVMTPDGLKVSFIYVGRPVSELESGMQLEATDVIKGGIFQDSKVLILRYTPDGAIGVILNKKEYSENLSEEIKIGGPLASQSLIVVHNCEHVSGAQEVTDGVYLGGDYGEVIASGCARLEFWGFACWKAGQLDGEVRAGAWKPALSASSQSLFSFQPLLSH